MINASTEPTPPRTPEQKRRLLLELLAETEPKEQLVRLSFAQERIWFLAQLRRFDSAHNLTSGLRLSGELDVPALERAILRVVSRQHALRTVFVTVRGEPRQSVLPVALQPIPLSDLTRLPEQSLESEAYRIARVEARRPFDLSNGPLVRVRLLKLRASEHILLFAVHHIISDGLSIGLFVDDLAAFYEEETGATPLGLLRLPVQYTDYAEWSRTALDSGELGAQLDYWRKRLSGAPHFLNLPADRSRPREQSLEVASQSCPLADDLTRGVSTICKEQQATMFSFFLAGSIILLSRYTRMEDICVGVPVSGRNQVELEGIIGLFVNLLVIRIDLSGDPRFTDILARVQRALIEAHANQDVSFEALVRELQPERSLTHHPLVQVMTTGFKAPLGSRNFGPLSAKPYAVSGGASQFDLSNYFIETAAGQFWWQIDYGTALFDHARIDRMRGHFEQLIRAIIQNPERPISRLPLLTAGEEKLMSQWNNTPAEFPAVCVHELFEEQRRVTPERTAVEFDGKCLSYSRLNDKAEQLSWRLIEAGAGPGKLVGICVERSLEMVVGLLAILKTGAAYVPLDPAYPLERLAFIMEDAGVRTLLIRRGLYPQLEHLCEFVVYVDDRPQKQNKRCAHQEADSLAYVIYTSGSTGRPNGVAVPHRAVVNLLNSMRHKPGLDEGDRLLAVTTIAFDIAALEIFLPLAVGATIVVARVETAADGSKLLDAIRRRSITAMQATPATWRLLLAAGWTRETAQLKVLCGGESLPVDLASQLTARSDSVWNLYGPTETTIWSACYRLSNENIVPIGKPIRNTQLHVLDRHLQRVPIGIPGELFIGGAGVAKGYWNRIELTTQRFLPDPFTRNQSSVLFRTGDEVCLNASGDVEFLRRLDSQVKIRGFRIELAEVEAALARCEGVLQSAVVVREDAPGEHRLVGYVVARAGLLLLPPNLQAALRGTLAEYMIPLIVVIDRLPLTPNGKVDRGRLVSEEFAPVNSYEMLRPRDEIEYGLATIWEELLRLHPVGVRDSFFDLGGHSLLAGRLFARIQEKFGASLPLATLFHEPTIEHLANQLRHRHAITNSCLEPLNTSGTRPPLFMGGSNPRYLEISRRLGPGQPVYKMDLYAAAERRVAAGLQPYTNLEEYAAEFVNEIRAIQPSGPYFLGGGCDGGILSLEIARQIRARGDQVGLLVLWETPMKGFFERDWCGTALDIIHRLVQALAGNDVKASTARIVTHPLLTAEQTRHQYIYNSYWAAIRRYTPPKYLGAITIIRARKQRRFYKDIAFGWNRIATQGIEVHSVPGDHSSYFTEFFPEFTRVLAAILERAQTLQAHTQNAYVASSE